MPVMQNRYAKGFSDMAPTYVDLSAQAERLLDLAELQPGEDVLDVGCGPGTATLIAAARVGPTGSVAGVDLAANMLALAAERTAHLDHVTIREGDAVDLGIADGTYDVVVANSVVQFTGPRSLTEWKRVVRPRRGRVACSLPWGPAFWFELCQRYVDRTAEPFRTTFRQRLATTTAPPNAERACALHGFRSVTTDVQDIVRRYDTPEAAWESEYSHGARIFLEELPLDALAQFREEYLDAVRTADGGAEVSLSFHYWCFHR